MTIPASVSATIKEEQFSLAHHLNHCNILRCHWDTVDHRLLLIEVERGMKLKRTNSRRHSCQVCIVHDCLYMYMHWVLFEWCTCIFEMIEKDFLFSKWSKEIFYFRNCKFLVDTWIMLHVQYVHDRVCIILYPEKFISRSVANDVLNQYRELKC